ncbi:MAG TPA: hypothetical protein VF139_06055 [Candidatus Polarisedimenticolaceae bacterium]
MRLKNQVSLLALTGLVTLLSASPAAALTPASTLQTVAPNVIVATPPGFTFPLTRSAGVNACLPQAQGQVTISDRGLQQQLDVVVAGLPANTTFSVFVTQLPRAPFGLSWYQGEVRTDDRGLGRTRVVGIFSEETFLVAPGAGIAPIVDAADAGANVATAPLHLLHLGLWFDSPADAVAAGCSGNVTPFNGEHHAGVQVLNTSSFGDGDGPLGVSGR